MKRSRQYDRVPLMADLTIRPGEKRPLRFAGRVFNISRGGLAVFSRYYFPPGVLVALELTVPVPDKGLRGVMLYGVTRWARVQADGNLIGIEILSDSKAGDYEWFNRHFDAHIRTLCHARYRPGSRLAEDSNLPAAAEDN